MHLLQTVTVKPKFIGGMVTVVFLGDVIIEIANRFNESQDEYMVIPTGKGSYEDNMAATIAAFRQVINLIIHKSMMQVQLSW